MIKNLFITLIASVISIAAHSQLYLSEVFPNVTITNDVIYGSNISVVTGSPSMESLVMDVYEPTGDTDTARPVVIVLHDGNYLPAAYNDFCIGNKTDSSVVEICTRLAKYGYVVAAINYRLGWNPFGTQEERTGTFLNANYRAVQDTRNAVRYFRWSIANGNQFKVADTKFSIIGEGTGAEIALSAGSLDKYSEIELAKYINPFTTTSFVDTSLSGNMYGTNTRPINIANYPTYSSDVNFIGNIGGTVMDSTWIEANDPATVSFHCPNDPYHPFAYGAKIVPATGDFVTNLSGSSQVMAKSTSYGNNDIYINEAINDAVTAAANLINNGNKGLFPFYRPTVENAPWQWWDAACSNNTNATATNPDMSVTKAKAYIDTIISYLAPRMAFANGFYLNTTNIANVENENSFSIYPNPSSDVINVANKGNVNSLINVEIMDITGRVIYKKQYNTSFFSINTSGFISGNYFMKLHSTQGEVIEKIIVNRN